VRKGCQRTRQHQEEDSRRRSHTGEDEVCLRAVREPDNTTRKTAGGDRTLVRMKCARKAENQTAPDELTLVKIMCA
jgi:hypothetical protein